MADTNTTSGLVQAQNTLHRTLRWLHRDIYDVDVHKESLTKVCEVLLQVSKSLETIANHPANNPTAIVYVPCKHKLCIQQGRIIESLTESIKSIAENLPLQQQGLLTPERNYGIMARESGSNPEGIPPP